MSDKTNARDLRAAAREALRNESKTYFARQPDSESGKTRFSSTPAGRIDDKSSKNNIDNVRPIENLDSFLLNTPSRQRKQELEAKLNDQLSQFSETIRTQGDNSNTNAISPTQRNQSDERNTPMRTYVKDIPSQDTNDLVRRYFQSAEGKQQFSTFFSSLVIEKVNAKVQEFENNFNTRLDDEL